MPSGRGKSASVKGKAFEYVVRRLLLSCGFKLVRRDGLLVYWDGAGNMIQGLGQPHNADVLLEPPFQTPFYYRSRILVECKGYKEAIGLPVIRNALGLREDVNHFDIVTVDILKNRKASNTTKPKSYPITRYAYQVAVASLNGFKNTAFPYAEAHRIPLISFGNNPYFAIIRDLIAEMGELAKKNSKFKEDVLDFFRDEQDEMESADYAGIDIDDTMKDFVEEIRKLEKATVIGLLSDGNIIFLVKVRKRKKAEQGVITEKYVIAGEDVPEDKDISAEEYVRYNDGYSIHWQDTSGIWTLQNEQEIYQFELPREIYARWIGAECEQRQEALQIKQDYLSEIILFENWFERRERRNTVKTIYLSERFMEEAAQKLAEQSQNEDDYFQSIEYDEEDEEFDAEE